MKARDSLSSPPISSVSRSGPRNSSTGSTTMLALLRRDVLSREILRPLRKAASPTRRFGSLSVLPAIGKPQFTVRATQETATASPRATPPTPGFWISTLPLQPIRQAGTNELATKKGRPLAALRFPANRLSDSDLSHSAIHIDLDTGDVGS